MTAAFRTAALCLIALPFSVGCQSNPCYDACVDYGPACGNPCAPTCESGWKIPNPFKGWKRSQCCPACGSPCSGGCVGGEYMDTTSCGCSTPGSMNGPAATFQGMPNGGQPYPGAENQGVAPPGVYVPSPGESLTPGMSYWSDSPSMPMPGGANRVAPGMAPNAGGAPTPAGTTAPMSPMVPMNGGIPMAPNSAVSPPAG